MSKIKELYKWVEEEYGTPLVVHPQGYPDKSTESELLAAKAASFQVGELGR